MDKVILRSLLVISLAAGVFLLLPLFRSSSQNAPNAPQERRKSLLERAQEQDTEIAAKPHSENETDDLPYLAKNSHGFVIGRIISEQVHFTSTGEHIVTEYQITVSRVLKDVTMNNIPLLPGIAPPAPVTRRLS